MDGNHEILALAQDTALTSYVWNIGNETLLGGSTLPYTFDQNGYYLVSLSSTDSTGCSWTESQLHWVNSTTVPELGFTVFPNPCESSFWIVVSDPWVGKSYTVTNSMGQHVAHGTVTGNSQLIAAPWTSGVYLIEMDGRVRRLVVE